MLVLPISLVVSLILGFQLLRLVVKDDRPRLFAALLAMIVLQGVIVSLGQYYGITWLRTVQPVVATIIPPLAWITFMTTAVRPAKPLRDSIHLAVPVFTAFCVAFAPVALDIVITAVFAIYGLLILMTLRKGPDGLPLTRLDADVLPGWIWGAIGLSLMLSALSDTLIAWALMTDHAWLMPKIISAFSSFYLLLVGALSLSQNLAGKPNVEDSEVKRYVAPADIEDDAQLMSRLKALLEERELYLDPDLTLARLSKRLGVPAKQLSTTINRATGENVSRYINSYRIGRARERLAAGETVTVAMLESGFNTKSNFNREFLRVVGSTPSQWRAGQQA